MGHREELRRNQLRITGRIPPASNIRIAPLTRAHAEDMATWAYEAPYDLYDTQGAEPDELLDPAAGFHAVLAGDELIGFRSFGPDGQVPGWDYDDTALDTGGGCGPRSSARASAGLAFGRSRFAPRAFRVTVASFNGRARRTVVSLGFELVGSFDAARDGRPFDVLVRSEPR